MTTERQLPKTLREIIEAETQARQAPRATSTLPWPKDLISAMIKEAEQTYAELLMHDEVIGKQGFALNKVAGMIDSLKTLEKML